jgi:hypothetical protein
LLIDGYSWSVAFLAFGLVGLLGVLVLVPVPETGGRPTVRDTDPGVDV